MGTNGHRGRRAVFLDRDGVINQNVLNPATGKYEAPLAAADFALIPGVTAALRQLQSAGFLLFLVSNQPNYAKGKANLEQLNAIDAELRRKLAAIRVEFSAVYYCLHHPDGIVADYSGPCMCRKPSPYFLLKAMREFGLDAAWSWMVGDRVTDVLCGRAAGVRTVFIDAAGVGCGEVFADRVASDLAAAAGYICGAGAVRENDGGADRVPSIPIPSASSGPTLWSKGQARDGMHEGRFNGAADRIPLS